MKSWRHIDTRGTAVEISRGRPPENGDTRLKASQQGSVICDPKLKDVRPLRKKAEAPGRTKAKGPKVTHKDAVSNSAPGALRTYSAGLSLFLDVSAAIRWPAGGDRQERGPPISIGTPITAPLPLSPFGAAVAVGPITTVLAVVARSSLPSPSAAPGRAKARRSCSMLR